jgi:hypothetical protein
VLLIEILDYASQAVITCTGFLSLYLMASQEAKVRMYAGLVGLFGEPFWFFTAYINEQYGILILVLIYGVNWIRLAYSNYRVAYASDDWLRNIV